MDVDAAKTALRREIRLAYPRVRKASELPFHDYWKAQEAYIAFHAPHLATKIVEGLARGAVHEAKDAERIGTIPKPWIVSNEVKEIWRAAGQDNGDRLVKTETSGRHFTTVENTDNAKPRRTRQGIGQGRFL